MAWVEAAPPVSAVDGLEAAEPGCEILVSAAEGLVEEGVWLSTLANPEAGK